MPSPNFCSIKAIKNLSSLGFVGRFLLSKVNSLLEPPKTFLYSLSASYNVSIRIDNSGFGKVETSFCNSVINIIPRPVPPTLSTTVLSLFDLVGGGTMVGSLGPVNNNNVAAGNNYTTSCKFNTTDAAGDDFVISSNCIVYVKSGKFLDSFIKGTYTYTVNASDALSWAIYSITITLLQSSRPPTTFVQTRFINDTAGRNSFIFPPLEASHAQSKALTFSLTDASGTFDIYPNGTLFVKSNAPLFDFNARSVYSLTFGVTDTSSFLTTSTVTITVIDTNKAPAFSSSTLSRSVNEGSAVGELIGLPISASDLNLIQTITHSITSCQPQMWSPSRSSMICPISIDAASGQLSVSDGLNEVQI